MLTFDVNVYVSGISSVGTAITMYPTGNCKCYIIYGDGSNLSGVATDFTYYWCFSELSLVQVQHR